MFFGRLEIAVSFKGVRPVAPPARKVIREKCRILRVFALPKQAEIRHHIGPSHHYFPTFYFKLVDPIMSQQILQLVEQSSLKEKVDEFGIGDTVDVHTKIQEGTKERIQIFSGIVIAKSGSGTREMFVVRRIVAGEGVERKFPLHSPRIEKIEVKRRSVIRRAKLYFLRERSGKAVRLKERRIK
jgi:large subunit ribosomal protein L19